MELIGYFRDLSTGRSKLFSQLKEGEFDGIPLFSPVKPDQTRNERRIVAAANRYGDVVVVSARHHDPLMNTQLLRLQEAGLISSPHTRDQGFIDNRGEFLSREDALLVATAAGQINTTRPKTSPKTKLFSEDLY